MIGWVNKVGSHLKALDLETFPSQRVHDGYGDGSFADTTCNASNDHPGYVHVGMGMTFFILSFRLIFILTFPISGL
jgi:hypothetical protein